MKLSNQELTIVKQLIKTRRPNTRTTITIKRGWSIGIGF